MCSSVSARSPSHDSRYNSRPLLRAVSFTGPGQRLSCRSIHANIRINRDGHRRPFNSFRGQLRMGRGCTICIRSIRLPNRSSGHRIDRKCRLLVASRVTIFLFLRSLVLHSPVNTLSPSELTHRRLIRTTTAAFSRYAPVTESSPAVSCLALTDTSRQPRLPSHTQTHLPTLDRRHIVRKAVRDVGLSP
jgi:hypothetical protein